jgi:putative inorganic carbon (HCO3(-)) transporter
MTFPLTLLFMFLVFWRPQEWLFPWMFGWPVLDIITYVSLLSLLMEMSHGTSALAKTPAVMLAVGLWFSTLMSHIAHGYFQGMLDTLSETFKVCVFLVLLLIVLDRASRIRSVMLIMVAAAIIMSVHALMQQKTGYGFAGAEPLWVFKVDTASWESRSQFFGIFADPNDLAQYLATAIPLVFACPKRLNPISILVCSGIVVLLFLALLATHSRGGQVALLAVGCCIVFLRLPVRWLPYAVVIGLIGALVLCRFKGDVLLDQSAQERVVFWGLANERFKANPLFGLGYGMFWQVTSASRAAHNAFVLCYTELGIFGYWFWFTIFQLGMIGCWRARAILRRPRSISQEYLKRTAGLMIVASVGFNAGSYFLSRAFVFPLFFLFGVANAIPLIVQRALPDDHPPLLNARQDVVVSGTITTFASIAYIYVSILLLNKAIYG